MIEVGQVCEGEPVGPKTGKETKAGILQQATAALYRMRRRIATGFAFLLVAFLAYHVVFGRNGLNSYEQKKTQDRQLQQQIEMLKQENSQLKDHDSRLKNDPDAIEYEAREKLHYAKPGEVIYTLSQQPQQQPNDKPQSRQP